MSVMGKEKREKRGGEKTKREKGTSKYKKRKN